MSELAEYRERHSRSGRTPLIVDAGANIGASSVYFALKFPDARIIAVEPGAENHCLLAMNSAGLNVDPRLAALASKTGTVSVIDVGAGFWGLRTAVSSGDNLGVTVPACTVNDIYAEQGSDFFPYIVKIDIEGGEKDLFSQNTEWISRTPCIIIELHDWMLPGQGTSHPFLRCISQCDRDFIHIGENVFSISNNLDELFACFAQPALRGSPSVSGAGFALSDVPDGMHGAVIDCAADEQIGDAASAMRQALTREPNSPELLLRLSYALLHMKCYEEGLHHARHFLRIVNDVAFGYYLAGHAARELGLWREGRSYLLRAVELDPSHVYARVLCCMSLFTVAIDESDLRDMAVSYSEELAHIVSSTPLVAVADIDAAVDGIRALPPFFLPYLGGNVLDLQLTYGSWICSVMAAKYPRYSHVLQHHPPNGKIRVGIVSNYFYRHSNWKIPIKGWLQQLDRAIFSIYCVYTGEIGDDETDIARQLADNFLHCSDIEKLAPAISEMKLDVLIYPGLGMDSITLMLAALRLAPVQCTSWGHPVTTGMPTVDHFISSELMEPLDGDAHYSEELVRLPNLSVWYEASESVAAASTDKVIPGVEPHHIVFLCCQNILKYLPRYDYVFPEIAGHARSSRFVFIASPIAELNEKFICRLERAFESRGLAASDYVSVLPQLDSADFNALNARSDIFLDSIEWSGCNTVFESLPYNKPIVTIPGTFMRGRHASAILHMIGVTETIAATPEEYIAIAVRLATDNRWRQEMSAKIAGNKHKVYRDRASIRGLEDFLVGVTGRLR
ncbi:MAG: FkbM family methyltransferase [Desulfuromonadales bacterium]